ncbi:type II toxin-antitoxin system Phd/YefM family antitoxin [Pseudidiomarina donghaiensis]|uniref:Antitoxin n=1 Tax=Pseudidiomarina donghaiensis TaxID=519452 RepID=A0A432XL13_9GAMM|nr:type II toxin-antitoxin system prevent-host-death family antitoxin [Pseudidiomarina donghaiensis]RUO49392.1 type II toxin-antitoxin system prevent-host-death family antitoxin [Pseudidiomarina donghaiensis]SFV21139.1 antitoxin YefM [Pseudidiomarina donghaiensis]
MRVISYSDARNNLKAVIDTVVDDADVTVIARRDADDAVIMSLAHYNGLMETIHLLNSLPNAARLKQSIAQLKAGEVIEAELDESGLKDGD